MFTVSRIMAPGPGKAYSNIGYVQPRGSNSNLGYNPSPLLRTLSAIVSRIPPQPVIRKTPQQLREETLQRWSSYMHSQTTAARAETERKVQQVITRRLPQGVIPLPPEQPKIVYREGRQYTEMPGGGYVTQAAPSWQKSQPIAPARRIVQQYIPSGTTAFRQRAQLVRRYM